MISVLMSVYNCAQTITESLNAILSQTEPDWELILCDDGSSDETPRLLREFAEKHPEKVTILQNETNLGLSASLNRCLAAAKGEFVARMDGDDLCSKDRFEKELRLLREHPEYAVVSTDMECFDDEGIWGLMRYPTNPPEEDFVHGTPFCHAACMARREVLQKIGGYSELPRYARVEDYHLWMKLYQAGFKGMNLHEPLYQMRDDRNAASRRSFQNRLNEARIRMEAVKTFHLPAWKAIYALRPLILGILPGGIYNALHRAKLGK